MSHSQVGGQHESKALIIPKSQDNAILSLDYTTIEYMLTCQASS